MSHIVANVNNYPPKVLKREIEKQIYKGEPRLSRLRRTLKLEFPFLSYDEIQRTTFEKIDKPKD